MSDTDKTESKRGKTKGYKSFKIKAKQDRKRKEAEARNKAWRALTKEQQIQSLQSRRGNSKKQIEKIKSFNTNR